MALTQTTLILNVIATAVLVGLIIGFLRIRSKKRSQVKNSIKRIKNQKMKYVLNGKPYDFVGKIDKELKQKEKGREKTQWMKKPKKPKKLKKPK